MYYLSTYTYIEQLKHKRKLGFKYNEIETIIMVFYALKIAHQIINYIKSKEFKNYIKKLKEKYNGIRK